MMKQPKEQYKPTGKLELNQIKKEFPKVFKTICCPSCGEDVTADNVNLQNIVAKCGSCHVIFSIEEEVKNVKATKEMKQELLRPEGIDLFFYKDDLDITVQQHLQGVDAFGVILMPIFALFSLFVFFTDKHDISAYIPIALSLGALYFIYRAFNYTNNKTYIDVNDKFLSIKSRPKHFRKDMMYAADEIDQLYLKHAADGSGYYTIFIIINGLEGQQHKKLITVNSLSKAKYLEQEIERYLNITDRKIPEANA